LRSGSFTNGTPGPLSAGAGAFTDRQSMKRLIALNFCVKRFSERFEPFYGEQKVSHLLHLNHLMVELFKELGEMKSFHHFTIALCFGNFSDQFSELNGTTLTYI